MTAPRSPWVATFLLVLAITTWSYAGWQGTNAPTEPVRASDLAWGFSFLAFPIVGWLIAVKRRRNPLGWLFLASPTLIAMGIIPSELAAPVARAGYGSTAAILQHLGGWSFSAGAWMLLVAGLLLFPDGRLPSKRWRWVLWGSLATLLILGVIELIGTETVCVEFSSVAAADPDCVLAVANPLSLLRLGDLAQNTDTVTNYVLYFTTLLSLVGLIVRFRRSTAEARQQIKWVALVATVGLTALIGISAVRDALGLVLNEWAEVLPFMAFTIGFPLAIGASILKYRLYDIDRVLSLTVGYTIVIGMLALLYTAGAVWVPTLLVGDSASPLFVVGSTLAVAALLHPLRKRILRAVERRFHRDRYDPQRVLEDFSARLRIDAELEQLQSALLSTVQETIQPTYLSLWVRRGHASDPGG